MILLETNCDLQKAELLKLEISLLNTEYSPTFTNFKLGTYFECLFKCITFETLTVTQMFNDVTQGICNAHADSGLVVQRPRNPCVQ